VSYAVEYLPPAEDELISAWTAAPDQALVTAVVHRLEQLLRINPWRVGRPYQSPLNRVVLASPVGMWFDIVEDDKKVLVLSVWSIP